MLLSEAMQGHMMDAKIDAEVSPRYFDVKRQRLGYFVLWSEQQGITTLEAITPIVLRAFIIHLQGVKAYELNPRRPTLDKPLSPMTIKGYMLIVQAFFSWCEREGLLEGRPNPARRIPRIKVPRYVIQTFTPEQMTAMLDACEVETPLGYRDYTMLLVLMDTGIRVSELCGLTLDDLHDNYITVFGKGAKEREVGIGPTTSRALWKYLHIYRPQLLNSEHERHVFVGYRGIPLLRNGINQLLERIGERAGITGVRMSPHTFRHTFARAWLENGGEIFKLSRILGHSEMQTTQIYLRDFQSREARVDHTQFSPVERNNLGKLKRGNGRHH
ncbi:MAG TPA: tyrosine-type recombinase/integrase [Ktedonobacterales bacterium]|nr:tyrosine-type recombinase/integrase [Ktedonobacterales bacterium]